MKEKVIPEWCSLLLFGGIGEFPNNFELLEVVPNKLLSATFPLVYQLCTVQ